MDYRQKNWPEWLVLTEFVINNKAYSTTKVSLFIANYGRYYKIIKCGQTLVRIDKI